MKKYYLLTVFLIILLVIGFFVGVPYYIGKDSTRQIITDYIETTYKVRLKADSLHWNWLPAPHLSVYDVKLAHEHGLICTLPQLKIYPDLGKLFIGKIQPQRLDLQRPHFILKPTLFQKRLEELPIPITDIHMEEASLDLDSPAINNLPALSLDLNKGALELKHLAGRLHLTLEAQASCAEKISFKGRYNPSTKHYSASTNLKHFNLDKLIRSAPDFFSPLTSTVNMQWSCSGVRGQGLQGSFQGDIPAFTIHFNHDKAEQDSGKPQTDFRFRKANFDLEKNKDGIFLTANDISLAQPDCALTGTVNRLSGNENPVYQLDLKGTQIDLNDIRQGLLNVLGGNKTTREVCNIVRGGKAAEATYRFEGEVADFKDIKNMEIGVDVTTSEIMVPGINLHLKQTSGPISIDDGVLTGQGLKTTLSNSLGESATIAVGLTPKNDLFQLEIDLDADISELPNVLFHLIDREHFRQEIKKFQGQGRARAHLSMGDKLTDFHTGIVLNDGSEAVITYDRFYWPIIFKKGHIYVDQNIGIRDCVLESGPHHIANISGTLSRHKGDDPRLNITEVTAELDGSDILSYLRRYPKIGKIIDPHLTSIKGIIAINDSQLAGPLFNPQKWKYLLDFRLNNNRITSPHLSGSVDIESARVQLQEDHLSLEDADINYKQSPLHINAELDHNQFSKWQGNLTLSGFMNGALADWLGQSTSLPSAYMPVTPCKIDSFKLEQLANKLDIQGRISRKKDNNEVIGLDFNLVRKASKIRRLRIQFTTPTDGAVFTMQRANAQEKTTLNWQGTLKDDTLTTLFADLPLQIGRIQGNFHIVLLPAPGLLEANGYLKTEDLQWKDTPPYTVIKDMHVTGKDRLITIEDMKLAYNGEEAEVTGDIEITDRQPEIQLALSSSFLSRNNVADFTDKFLAAREDIADFFPRNHGEIEFKSSIEVDCSTFMFTVPGKQNGKARTLIINPLQGRGHSTDRGFIFELDNSGFCGLKLEGSLWHSGDQLRIREIRGSNPANRIVRFENTLPCLDIEDSIIQGSFTTDFFIGKENEKYDNGRIVIHSSNGKILKWGLLAKIFQVVNITDLGKFLEGSGFNYDRLTGEGHIANNILTIDKAELKGHGLDLLARGTINLEKMSMDVMVFLVPLKTIDTILSKIPLVGRLIQGREGHIVTIPIGVKGKVADPAVTTLPPKAVGQGAINFIRDTISFPIDIIPRQGKE